MLLGTLHLAFPCGWHRVVSFGHILSCTPGWFDCYSYLICLFWVTFGDVLEGAWVLGMALEALWEIHFSFRIRVLLFICWLEWVRASLVSLWGSSLFFGRAHFIPLTIHTFFSLQCSCSLHSWALLKRGIFVDPLGWEACLLFFYLFIIFLFPAFSSTREWAAWGG